MEGDRARDYQDKLTVYQIFLEELTHNSRSRIDWLSKGAKACEPVGEDLVKLIETRIFKVTSNKC